MYVKSDDEQENGTFETEQFYSDLTRRNAIDYSPEDACSKMGGGLTREERARRQYFSPNDTSQPFWKDTTWKLTVSGNSQTTTQGGKGFLRLSGRKRLFAHYQESQRPNFWKPKDSV